MTPGAKETGWRRVLGGQELKEGFEWGEVGFSPLVRGDIGNGRTRKVVGPGLTRVRMSQAVEVVLI